LEVEQHDKARKQVINCIYCTDTQLWHCWVGPYSSITQATSFRRLWL